MESETPTPPAPARRKSRARWIIPIVLLTFFIGFIAMVGLVVIAAVSAADTVANGSVLELRFDGSLRESPDPVGAILPGLSSSPSLFEIREALQRAARDSRIIALKVDIVHAGFGWAEAQEVSTIFDEFRASGKPVYAFVRGDMVSEIDYAVALPATKLWVAPGAALLVNGLRAEVEFWKGTLDKLNVEPQFFMMKEYKSAGEIYSRSGMSEPFRESLSAVLDDIWAAFTSEVSTRRGIDPDAVRATTDIGILTAKQAKEAHWVDGTGYEEDVRAAILAESGNSPGSYLGIPVSKYLRGSKATPAGAETSRFAVIFGEGVIVSSGGGGLFDDSFSGTRVAAAIREAADDDGVAAILFRVNSPGGAVVGSDHVRRAIQYAREEQNKVVVATMSSVAGSGGYWVSLSCNAIVAQPSTITGSIGVVFGKFDVSGLYEKIGGHVDTVETGKNASLMSLVETFNDDQRRIIEAWLQSTYDDFKGFVANGRSLSPEKVEEIARGRIWSGTDAKELGLVDELGGYSEAIAMARDQAAVPANHQIELAIYPPEPSLLEVLFADDGVAHAVGGLLGRHSSTTPALLSTLRELTRPGAWALTPGFRIE